MVARRRPPLLLLLCLAALAVSVAGKKCRDRKTAKGCVKKRDKGFCQEEATCPKPKKDGKKCKQTRKKCSLTCGLCTPGIDPVTNQPINPNYDPQSTVLTDMLTACGCTAEVDGVDMRPTSAAPYFCVKTELKGPNEDALTPVTICRGGHGAPNAPTCPGGEQVCGRSGYPSPPPSPSPSPPPTPTPPPSAPVVSPPSTPPTCTTSVSPITTRAALIAAMDLWCSAVDTTTLGDGVGGNAKDAAAKCAPSTWHVKMAAGVTLGLVGTDSLFAGSACDVATWGSVAGDDMNGWDVSEVTDMDSLFKGATVFKLPLNAWDVGKVTSMKDMFENADAFNQDLNSWNTAKVTTMYDLFYGAAAFNGMVGAWDVSQVTDMGSMFEDTAFNQPLNAWDVAKVTTMFEMFLGAASFSQEIGSWNVAKVTDMEGMFDGATAFKQNLNDWDVSQVTVMEAMFEGATAFNAPLNAWNVAKVNTIMKIFLGAAAFNQDISAWDVGAIITDGNANSATVQAAFHGTGLSDCNKRAIYNHFTSQTPPATFFTFGGGNGADATEDSIGNDGADWSALC